MHLHSMRFAAIGPFAGEHTIDFGRLAASGLFLLEGPTGAGKSTIIDAVVFALYGKPASAAASDERLRSSHAGTAESFVDLVFETSAGIFRVRRTPEYQRPKLRGEGFTTQKASIALWRLAQVPVADAVADAPGELLSHRLDEAGPELGRLIGLDRAQFVQTVILPQGEFAQFLRAKPEDRAVLLQRVFGTEVYVRMAAALAENAREAGREIEAAGQRVADGVNQFVGAAGLDGDAAAELGGAPEPQVVEMALDVVRGLEAETHRLERRVAGADGESLAARAALDDARATDALIRRRASLRERLAHLDRDAAALDRDRTRLAAAARAAVVAPALAGVDRVRADVRAARAQVAETAKTLLGTGYDGARAAGAAPDAAALDEARAAAEAAAARLEAWIAVAHSLADRESALAGRRKDVERDDEERRRLVQGLAERPAERAELAARLTAALDAAASLPALLAEADRCRSVCAAAHAAHALAADLTGAQQALDAAAADATAAVDAERTIRQARIRGLAGELAGNLAPDLPCPVCGSREHPRPATPEPGAVRDADVKKVEAARVAADAAVRHAHARVAELRAKLDLSRAAATGAEPAAADRALADAEERVSAARALAAARAQAEADLADFDDATARGAERRLELERSIEVERRRIRDEDEDLAARGRELDREIAAADALLGRSGESDGPGEPGGAGGLDAEPGGAGGAVARIDAALEAVRTRIAALWAVREARAALRHALRTEADRVEELERLAVAQGFASASAAADAVLDEATYAELHGAVDAAAAERTAVEAGLADPAVMALAEDAATDLPAARAAAATADARARDAAGRLAHEQRRARAARVAAESIQVAVAAADAVRRRAAPVLRMAALTGGVGGDNAKGLSLATYVLIRQFEDVVAAANERLREISGGRYELERTELREDVRARKVGLALRVMDHVVEEARDPRTLSGGETFYVSLCLALGLADVVSAEAGGVELGTLFVDEGFGTLDAESLDTVLTALGRLRAAGRVVGVVSHVEAMKQTIAERVEVRCLPAGGSTLTVRA